MDTKKLLTPITNNTKIIINQTDKPARDKPDVKDETVTLKRFTLSDEIEKDCEIDHGEEINNNFETLIIKRLIETNGQRNNFFR